MRSIGQFPSPFVVGVVLLASMPVMSEEGLAWDDPLTPSERLGRTIYHQGRTDAGEEVRVSLAGSGGSLSATLFRCVQCHGVWGQGGEEGGLRVPPLTPSFLTRSHTSPQTGQSREAYTDQTLIRAMTQGMDASGFPLHSGMPRYQFNEHQAKAVVAYLRKMGSEEDSDPGVMSTTITIGAALPLSGPLAEIGQDTRSVMEGYFRNLNERGGVYGRQIRLIIEDAGNSSSQLEAATARLIKTEQIFALVGSFEFGESSGTRGLIEQAQVPLIGPLALSPQPADPPNPYIFYTLPGFDVQYTVLLDFVVSQARSTMNLTRPRVAVIRPTHTAFLNTVLTPSRRKMIDVSFDYEYARGSFDRNAFRVLLQKRSLDAVLFVGDGEDFLVMCRELEQQQLSPLLLAAAGMVGHRVMASPPSLRSKVFLAAAIQPPTEEDRYQLQTLAGPHQLSNLGYARMAQVAAFMFSDVLMKVGRQVNRGLIVEEFERYRGVDTGVGFRLSYGPQKRVGSSRARIFRVMPESPHFVPITDWITPQDLP